MSKKHRYIRFGITLQLILFAGVLVAFAVAVSTWFAYQNSKKQLETALGNELLALVNSAAPFINGDYHEEIVRVDSNFVDGMDAFHKIREQLIILKEKNHLGVESSGSPVYTLRPAQGFRQNEKMEFVVMTDKNAAGEFFIGNLIHAEKHHLQALQGLSVTTGLYADSEGMWVSAVAPVHDSLGNVVAILQADRNVDFFFTESIKIAKKLLWVAAVVVAIAVLLSIIYSLRLIWPIRKIVDAAISFGKGDLQHKIEIHRSDELGVLASTFNMMSRRIRIDQAKKRKQSQALEKLTKALSDANRNLESKVVERTKQLTESHEKLEETLAALKSSQATLVQSEKMASLGQLAAGVAHEINNPMAFITSNLTMLQDYNGSLFKVLQKSQLLFDAVKSEDKEAIRKAAAEYIEDYKEADIELMIEDLTELLSDSIDGALRVRDIVADLKGYSHAGDGKDMQLQDINQCLASVLKITHNATKHNSKIITDFASDLPSIYCHAGKLHQVFTNIVVNAAQAIDESGIIEITTKVVEGDLQINFKDSGKGIAPESLEKIFDAFYTTKPVGEGTGLGLYISYAIIREHGGDLKVESQLGEGTEFIITLPIEVALEKKQIA